MNNINRSKHCLQIFLVIMVASLALILSACVSSGGSTGDEESGIELTPDETYDRIRNGARLVLTHDPEDNSFNGFVENTTVETIKQVRVEIHLSNGVELGPTTPVDIATGERNDIRISAKNFEFESWTAHPEVGGSSSEHGHSEDEKEHGEGGKGEHSEGDSD